MYILTISFLQNVETTKKSGNALESLTQAFYDTFKLKSKSSDAIDKSTPSPIPPKHLISWLHQTDHTNSVAKLSVSSSFTPLETPIIIDLRPTELYSQSHITDAFHVFVTPLLQKRWLRKSSIQPTADGTADAKINIETLIQPENRREEYKKLITEKNYVVVYDENMMENNLPGSVIWTIMNHLSKAGKVVHWIQGGFDAFAQENEFLFVNDQQTSSHEPATPLTPLTPIARTPSFSIQTSGLRTSLSKGKKFSLMCGNFASSSSSSSNLGTIEEPPKSALPGTPRLNNFDQKRLSSILASPSSSSPLTPTTPPNLDPSQILDFLYLGPDIYGNQINWTDVMQKLKVTHILNVAMECEPHNLAEVENKFVYKKWNVSDTPDEHIDEFLQETTAYIGTTSASSYVYMLFIFLTH
ncbi:hypothetical protein BKA69DRAFT_1139366 [Paraphysoderma sedebokerense]|nr:hypothetical protein BKA69DRAFT_1139366 [Paraphysoderma sedebokerense]